MLDKQIDSEVKRLASYGNYPEKKHKKIEGLIENYKEPLGKRVIDALFEGDIKTVVSSLTTEVLKPKAQDLLADLFIGGIEKWIYGDDTQRSYTRSGPSRKASYDAYYSGGKYYTTETAPVGTPRAKVRWDRIVMKSRPAAMDLLENLRSDIKRYKKISVTDLYDYVTDIDEELGAAIDSEFGDSNYGWTNLDRVQIESVRDGFWLKLPKPVPID